MTLNTEWYQLLRKVFLFSSFTASQLNIIAKRMRLVSFPKGAVLFKENDAGDALYIIVSGSIRIIKKNPITTTSAADEKSATLAYLNRGDVLGEMAVLTGEHRPHTAIVDATSELLVLSKADFERILEKNPALAVHLSRILSNRLAAFNRTGNVAIQPAKLFSIMAAIPIPDRVVFTVNLGLSLVEQTRKKVLAIVVEEGAQLVAKSLGLESPPLPVNLMRDGIFTDSEKFEKTVMLHPSGLEVFSIDAKTFNTSLKNDLPPFFSMLKDTYDICVIILPPDVSQATALTLTESDRVFMVMGPQSDLPTPFLIQNAEQILDPGKKLEKIWLSVERGSNPADFMPDFRFPWDPEWARTFLNTGSPFLPISASAAHRVFDRFARHLSQLVIGFAMGSGAAFGYALIGMLRVLEREGIYPDVISGTSMGALIGAFYANGISPDEMEKIAFSITRKRLLAMAGLGIPRTGIFSGAGILEFLRHHLNNKEFKELNLPFSCVATDITTGKEIVLDHGNVAEAVRASLSLPFFFQPYYLDGRYLVDGGLVNPVPTSITVAQGANILISANLTSKASERRMPSGIGWWRRRLPQFVRGPSIPEVLLKTIYIMQYEIAQARSEIAHVVFQIKSHDLLWWDLDRARDMISLGEASAEENLPKIKSLLPYFSDSCKVRLTRRGRKTY